jgi:transcriptional regulator with XRE-family HTH domain
MARKNPIPKRELEIAKRLRVVRQSNRLSMVAMAEALGINALRWMSYEYGKVPLPYSVGRKLCADFEVSSRWLATNVGGAEPSEPIPPEIESAIPDREVFSVAYDHHLKEAVEQYQEAVSKWAELKSIENLSARERAVVERRVRAAKDKWIEMINAAFHRGNHAERADLVTSIESTLRGYAQQFPHVLKFHDMWGVDLISPGRPTKLKPLRKKK